MAGPIRDVARADLRESVCADLRRCPYRNRQRFKRSHLIVNVATVLVTVSKKMSGGLLAVVVRAAVIAVPGIVRVIIWRVERIIARLGRAVNAGAGVIHVSAAANQKCKHDGREQRKNCCEEVATFSGYCCHKRLGRSFEVTP